MNYKIHTLSRVFMALRSFTKNNLETQNSGLLRSARNDEFFYCKNNRLAIASIHHTLSGEESNELKKNWIATPSTRAREDVLLYRLCEAPKAPWQSRFVNLISVFGIRSLFKKDADES